MKNDKLIPIAKVGDQILFGNKYEELAATLEVGDKVIFNRIEEEVAYVWIYDSVIVKLKSGLSIHPGLGETFLKKEVDYAN